MTIRLWGARHAPVKASGICYGHADVEVSISAEEAAHQLIQSAPFSTLTRVFTSPSARCRDIAFVMAKNWEADLQIDERLRELSMGRFEGRTWEDIERTDAEAYATWMQDWRTLPPPGGESPFDLERRVRSFLCEVDSGVPVVLVMHAGVWRALWVVSEGISWDEAMKRVVPHLTWMSMTIG